MKILITFVAILLTGLSVLAQKKEMYKTANDFINLLDKTQKAQTLYRFDTVERFVWNYIPKTDRKGISVNELNEQQKAAATELMKTALSENGYKKAGAIMNLEKVLKAIEQRPDDDHYRDPGKYYFTIFGEPSAASTWGWRLDGHHLSFNFSSQGNKLVSGTPGFFGANPAVVLSGPQKGLEILKEENELGLELVQNLNPAQLKKAVTNTVAPGDIITAASRKASIENPKGLNYLEMSAKQKEIFMQLLSIYIHRYTRLFADKMMHEIETAGMDKLLFSWEGSKENGPGHPRYYRIQGPTIIIEYDNTQNNGNHVHTVIRDLKYDFGGDELLAHYKDSH